MELLGFASGRTPQQDDAGAAITHIPTLLYAHSYIVLCSRGVPDVRYSFSLHAFRDGEGVGGAYLILAACRKPLIPRPSPTPTSSLTYLFPLFSGPQSAQTPYQPSRVASTASLDAAASASAPSPCAYICTERRHHALWRVSTSTSLQRRCLTVHTESAQLAQGTHICVTANKSTASVPYSPHAPTESLLFPALGVVSPEAADVESATAKPASRCRLQPQERSCGTKASVTSAMPDSWEPCEQERWEPTTQPWARQNPCRG